MLCVNGYEHVLKMSFHQMFEHMKNYEELLRKISTWLRPWKEGKESYLFVHIFCHKTTPYHFEEGDGWMAKTFFTGGTMASHDLFVRRIFYLPLAQPRSIYLVIIGNIVVLPE